MSSPGPFVAASVEVGVVIAPEQVECVLERIHVVVLVVQQDHPAMAPSYLESLTEPESPTPMAASSASMVGIPASMFLATANRGPPAGAMSLKVFMVHLLF